MEEIPRRYIPEGQGCFVCGPENSKGLKLKFFREGDAIVVPVTIPSYLVGWSDVVHGGVVAMLLDEAASWCVATVLKHPRFATVEINVRYHSPVRAEVPMEVRAKILKKTEPIIDLEAWIAPSSDSRPNSSAKVRIAIISEEKFNSFSTRKDKSKCNTGQGSI
ncbi:MAG: PaaI family thioesterase [Proteobacteria bacterium]|nr:PaaI family thioesterase [Pseudomonadota bacterium]